MRESGMFKHILLPNDGSEISKGAILACMAFAQEIGARVTGLHVIADLNPLLYQPEIVTGGHEQLRNYNLAQANNYLADIADAAKDAGVKCETLYVSNNHPYEAIVSVAQDKGCDLIAMASHGHKGMKGLLMGSETQKVLTHSTVPVLVFR